MNSEENFSNSSSLKSTELAFKIMRLIDRNEDVANYSISILSRLIQVWSPISEALIANPVLYDPFLSINFYGETTKRKLLQFYSVVASREESRHVLRMMSDLLVKPIEWLMLSREDNLIMSEFLSFPDK